MISFGAAILVSALFWMRAPAAVDDWRALLTTPPEIVVWSDALAALPIVTILFLCQFNVLSVHA